MEREKQGKDGLSGKTGNGLENRLESGISGILKSRRKRNAWLSAGLSLFLFAALPLTAWADTPAPSAGSHNGTQVQTGADSPKPDAATTDEVRKLIADYHYSGIGEKKLEGKDIQGMLNTLNDPYTVYFSKDGWQNFQNELENQYTGIGIRIGTDDHGFYADEVFDSSPAQKAGMQNGDYVVKVDGTPVKGMTLKQFTDKVKGPSGTTVKLTIERGGSMKDLSVKRGKIALPIVTTHWFPASKIGYLQLVDFSSQAGTKMAEDYKALQAKGMKSLIIDLRDNPGGLLTAAASIAKLFVKQGVLIHTYDHNKTERSLIFLGGQKADIPIYILVNQNSASAAEILTGVLQDYGVAKAIGTNTFGKGSVQTIFPLKNGGYLKLTIDEYRTPKNRKVNGVGLKPDIPVEGYTAQLVTAMHRAGANSITLDETSHDIQVNGIAFPDYFKTLQHDGKIYVPSRILSAMVGSDVVWDGADSEVVMEKNGKKRFFKAGTPDIRMDHNFSYIELGKFASLFPGFQWKQSGSDLQLQSSME